MECRDVIEKLSDFIGGLRLQAIEIREIAGHLESCGRCHMWWQLAAPLSSQSLEKVA
jgi:hypothetical protein